MGCYSGENLALKIFLLMMSLISPSKSDALSFRALEDNDRELLFEWRNIPEIISLSANQRPVSWAEHLVWFDKVISDAKYYVVIISEERRPIGQIRFEKTDENIVEIGIYLIPSSVGQGRGSRLIRQASALAKNKWPNLRYLKATIRQDNLRSMKAFEAAAFKFDADNDLNQDQELIRMTLDISKLK